MSEETKPDDVADAIALFMHGAKTLHVGYFLDNRSVEKKGFATIKKAIDTIDRASPTGREVLVPLLEHDDEGVRAIAAAGLWQSHFDRAVTVLTDLQDFGVTEASGFAIVLLMTRGQLNPCGSDPRFPSLYGKEGNELDGAAAAIKSELPPLGLRRPRA